MPAGRFAPSPTGDLHLGNLRTALAAWLFARSSGSSFLVRMEDLDRVQASAEIEASQLRDLALLGLDHDGLVVRQSDRFDRYEDAIRFLTDRGLTYPCFCTRREIQEASRAPHGDPTPDGAYPGTCRDLSERDRRAHEADGRPAALRLRAQVTEQTIVDDLVGAVTGHVDDVVLRRNDGVPAYNLAVVVDDDAQGIEQVVRGDDLLNSTPRQAHLIDLLGLAPQRWAHVPLVLGDHGRRLAKRDGAVTLREQLALGRDGLQVAALLAASLGQLDDAEPLAPCEPADLVERFDPARIPREAWVLPLGVMG